MQVSDLVRIYAQVSGLSENQAKLATYYDMATHKLKLFDWFPVKAYIGPPGTGKSAAMDLDAQLCYKPHRITCHPSMTKASLRDALVTAKSGTILIEECDLYGNRRELQGLLINRVDKVRTSGMLVKEMMENDSGLKSYRTYKKAGFGATIVHDRHSLDDLAAESRVITISTSFKEGSFIPAPTNLSLDKFKLGTVPGYFTPSGRAFDTWRPLLLVAAGQGDDEWLLWAYEQIQEATNSLKDGHAYEETQAVFGQVIRAYCDNNGMFLVKKDEGLILQTSVVEPLKKEMPYITARTVAKILTKLGLKVVRHSGTNKLFTTKEKLTKVASEIGYVDEVFEN